jgi:D-alanine-D-alanine ligase
MEIHDAPRLEWRRIARWFFSRVGVQLLSTCFAARRARGEAEELDIFVLSNAHMKHRRIALVYNAYTSGAPELPEDRASSADLRRNVRLVARNLRRLGHAVTVLPLADNMFAFQRKLRRLQPHVVFNMYDDVVHGALFEMRLAALVRMMGFPLTGSPALALGLTRYKFMSASLLAGAGIPIPPTTALLETVSAVDRHKWVFPLIVQPSQEHAGVGLDRSSVVSSKKVLREKVREILRIYNQPALAQHFLPGREFNVGIVGGNRLRVLPLAEVVYTDLPPECPPIMSYAAKWIETSLEYQKISVHCPADVEPELAQRIREVALRAFRAVGARGYGRVDMRLDENGEPCVLEVNCNPCLDEGIGLARSAERAGISFPQLLQLIVRAAEEPQPYDLAVPLVPPLERNSIGGTPVAATS